MREIEAKEHIIKEVAYVGTDLENIGTF
jgi:hypothetical protein